MALPRQRGIRIRRQYHQNAENYFLHLRVHKSCRKFHPSCQLRLDGNIGAKPLLGAPSRASAPGKGINQPGWLGGAPLHPADKQGMARVQLTHTTHSATLPVGLSTATEESIPSYLIFTNAMAYAITVFPPCRGGRCHFQLLLESDETEKGRTEKGGQKKARGQGKLGWRGFQGPREWRIAATLRTSICVR